jgi:hypothetical protein
VAITYGVPSEWQLLAGAVGLIAVCLTQSLRILRLSAVAAMMRTGVNNEDLLHGSLRSKASGATPMARQI